MAEVNVGLSVAVRYEVLPHTLPVKVTLGVKLNLAAPCGLVFR